MARDARRDHGFSMPDPQLTIELGIPNACDRCHAAEGAEWAVQRVGEWYSKESMEARRADPRAVAAARQGNPEAIPRLIEMAAPGGSFLRRASATRLLGIWAHDPQIQGVLAQQTEDEEAWVRMAAASALGFQAQRLVPGAVSALSALLADPVRAVRVEAQRSLRHRHDFTEPAMSDLRSAMVLQLAQPGGQAEFGSWLLARGDAQRALPHLERAALWDPWSPEFQRILAVDLASLGRSDEALERAERAVALAPEDAFLRFELALAYNETGRREDVIRELRGVVERAPAFSRAWYNLGLALRDSGDFDAALDALSHAEATEPSAAAPYARALILRELGRRDDAIEAAEMALERDPRNRSAAELLQELRAGGTPPQQPWRGSHRETQIRAGAGRRCS
jgi:tetratricopeptide (TPR) repeat protein